MTSVEEFEAVLGRAGRHPRFMANMTSKAVDRDRLTTNLAAINSEIDAPRPKLIARLLARLGVPDRVIPLVTATPALRRSWTVAVVLSMLFALNAASGSSSVGTDRIIVFLTIAPLIPVLGVALAFGPAVDPTHEVAVAAPMDGFRLFLVRAVTVFVSATITLALVSVMMPAGGLARIGWLLPALATTSVTMAVSTRFDPRISAGAVATTWILLVVVISQAANPSAVFGPYTQIISTLVGAMAVAAFIRQRRHLDELSIPSRQ